VRLAPPCSLVAAPWQVMRFREITAWWWNGPVTLRRGIAGARQRAHHGWPLQAIARGVVLCRVRGSRFGCVMRWSVVRPTEMGASR
jgi:hypothetical protein